MCETATMRPSLKEPAEIFKDLFICMIDFEPQQNPKMLKCGHSFCRDCLVGLLISMRRSSIDILELDDAPDHLKCPVCRCFTDVPETGIDGLPSNSMLEKLGDRVKELEEVGLRERSPSDSRLSLSPSGAQLCNMSVDCKMNRSPAKYFCHNCAKNCCEECHTKHNHTLEFHKTVDLSSDTATFIHCTKHEDEYISFYCMDCKVPLCTLCRIHDDQCTKHCVVEIMEKDQVLEERDSIKNYLEDLEKNQDEVSELSNQLENLRKEVYDMYTKSEDEMQQAHRLLLKRIEQTWNEFENQRQTSRAMALKVLDNAQEEVNYQMSNYTSLITFIQQLLENRDRFQPLSLFNNLKHRIEAAKQDVPCLDVLVPEIQTTRLVTTNPEVFTFAQLEEVMLKPVLSAISGTLHFQRSAYSDKTVVTPRRRSSEGGFFRPENDLGIGGTLPYSQSGAEQGGFFLPHDNLTEPPSLVSPGSFSPNRDGTFIPEIFDPEGNHFIRDVRERWSCNTYISETGKCIDLRTPQGFHDEFGNIRRSLSEHVLAQKTPPSKQMSIPAVKRNLKPDKSVISTLKKRFSTMKKGRKPVFHDDLNILWKSSLKLSSTASVSMLPSIIGLSLDGQKVYILDASQQCIAIFSDKIERGTLSLKGKPSMHPCSLAVSFDGQVFCTDLSKKTIEVFSSFLHSNETWKCIPGDTPLGICVTPDGLSVITTCETKHSHTRICIYNMKGEITVNRSFPRAEDSLMSPYVVVCNGETIAALDEKRNRLATYDMEIHPIATFSSPNLTLEGLCVGKDGEFYVSSASNSDLLRFDSKLHLLGNLNFKCLRSIKKPHRLSSCYSPYGEILLAVSTPIHQNEIGILLTDMTPKKK